MFPLQIIDFDNSASKMHKWDFMDWDGYYSYQFAENHYRITANHIAVNFIKSPWKPVLIL